MLKAPEPRRSTRKGVLVLRVFCAVGLMLKAVRRGTGQNVTCLICVVPMKSILLSRIVQIEEGFVLHAEVECWPHFSEQIKATGCRLGVVGLVRCEAGLHLEVGTLCTSAHRCPSRPRQITENKSCLTLAVEL